MATPPIDSLVDLINKKGLNEGNKVLDSGGTVVAGNGILYANSSQELASLESLTSQNVVFANGVPSTVDPATVVQPDNTDYVFDITAKGLESAITGSIVYYGGSTVTQTGAFRVLVTDSTGIGATTGTYYIPFGTLA